MNENNEAEKKGKGKGEKGIIVCERVTVKNKKIKIGTLVEKKEKANVFTRAEESSQKGSPIDEG